MSRLRIENAAHVVTVDDTDRILTDTTVEIDDGVITAITPATDGGPAPTRASPRSTPAASC